MISISNVTKVYRSGTTEVAALRGVSLEVERGEFLAIAGPSGSGKSTLLNLIGCLDVATGGDVLIDGQAVAGLSRKQLALFRRHHLGFVFQSFNLIPVLTAYENVSFALALTTRDAKEVRSRSLQMLQQVGLQDMTDRRPGELSGGQQQRVAIARALVKEPQIVLADEPTANVDSETGEGLLELMRTLNRQLGSTFIFSTHDAMVMDYAARLVRLQDGTIASDERRAATATATAGPAGAVS
jgi:putative ABC transport system ATP-binding protein